MKLTPLTPEERDFAAKNHGILLWYLQNQRLSKDQYYDVAAFGFLLAVKKWLHNSELHRWSFSTIACQTMRTYIANERRKEERRIHAFSLEETVPGTEGLTWWDVITDEHLTYFYTGGTDMNISYNVRVPERKTGVYGKKSDEVMAFENFIQSAMKNMCISYDTKEEAKKKLACLQAFRRKLADREEYEVFRNENELYVVKKKGRK